MKQVFVILTLAGLLLQTFGKGLVLLEFRLHQEYIARVLRINKAKPKLKCNGQCLLMKKMEEQQKKDKTGQSVKEKYEVIIAQTVSELLLPPADKGEKLLPAYPAQVAARPLHAVFHPPRA